MKKSRLFVLLICLLLAAPIAVSTSAFAGRSNRNAGSDATFKGSIDRGVWYSSGAVQSVENKLVFGPDVESYIFSKQYCNDNSASGVKDIINVETSITLDALSTQAPFCVRFGLNSFSSIGNLADSGEIVFSKDGDKVKVGVNAYNSSSTKTTLFESSDSGIAVGTEFKLSVDVLAGGKVSVTIGDTPFFDNAEGDTFFDGIGYFGFSKGKSEGADSTSAHISHVSAVAYAYDNPSNPVEVTENFDNGMFNSNAWFTISTPSPYVDKGYAGGTMDVKDGALLMNNVGEGLISTRHEYSNFELTFDIVDMHREPGYDESGKLIDPVSSWIGMSFGTAQANSAVYESVFNSCFFYFEYNGKSPTDAGKPFFYDLWDNHNRVVDTRFSESAPERYDGGRLKVLPEDNFWDNAVARDRTVNLKFIVKDGIFECFTKFEGEEFTDEPQFTVDIGYTPLGYVRILSGSAGELIPYCAIDNIKIKNTDINADDYKVTVEYQGNTVVHEKFQYTDTWNDADLLKDRTVSNSKGCKNVSAASAGAVSIVLLAAVSLLGIFRKTGKGEK